MRELVLKKVATAEVVQGKPMFLEYRGQIIELLKMPKDIDKGTDMEEMALTLPIIKKIRVAPEPEVGDAIVMLEEYEYDELAARLPNARFGVNAEEIYEMCCYIRDLPEAVNEDA